MNNKLDSTFNLLIDGLPNDISNIVFSLINKRDCDNLMLSGRSLYKRISENPPSCYQKRSFNAVNSDIIFTILSTKRYSRLEFLCIKNCHIPIEQMEFILTPNLRHLEISSENINMGFEIGAEGAKIIAKLLSMKINRLQNLNLTCNNIELEGIKALMEAVKINHCLQCLNLTGNFIKDEGATAIAEALKINNTLTRLNLRCNYITHNGAKVIAEALKENKKLLSLNFRYNVIGNEGAKFFASLLETNTVLCRLNLRYNLIEDEGVLLIMEALKLNTHLKELNLKDNLIEDNGANAILETLKLNSNLLNLNLECNEIQDRGLISLAKIVEANCVVRCTY